MLGEQTQYQIIDAIASGLSKRKTAQAVGVSRESVRRIVKRGYTVKSARQSRTPQKGPTDHCLGCGYIVEKPCRICRDRAALAARGKNRRPDEPDAKSIIRDHAPVVADAGGDAETYRLLYALHNSRGPKKWNAAAAALIAAGLTPPLPPAHWCPLCGSPNTVTASSIVTCHDCGNTLVVS